MATSRKRQTRLSFSPLPSSSPQSSRYSTQIRGKAAAVTYISPAKKQKTNHRSGKINFGITLTHSDSCKRKLTGQMYLDNHIGLATPKDSSQRKDPSDTEIPEMASSSRMTRSSARSASTTEDRMTRSKAPPLPNAQGPVIDDIGEPETSGDEFVISSPVGRRRATANVRSGRLKKRSNGMEDFIDDDEEDSEIEILSTKKRRGPVEVISDDSEGAEPSDEDDEEGSEIEILSTKKRRAPIEAISDEDDDLPVTPRKRRGERQLNKQEQEDLEEDLEFLRPSDDDTPQQYATGVTPKQDARSKALERLKKRRAGKKITISDDEPEDELDDDDAGEDDDLPEYRGRMGIPSSSATAMFEQDEDDEGFLIEDDDEEGARTLGAPTSLPIEFSGFASRKPKELFKFAVEWMVQKKLNPAFAMDDPIYELTFNKLDDEVKGLVGSKFMSSVWTPDFTRAIQARPNIEYFELFQGSGALLHDKCEACNRSGHPATWQIRLNGKPYHEATLEEVEQENEEDDEDEGEEEEEGGKQDYDSKGRPIPKESVPYNVGKFCANNARIGHALAHWRYHLNEWVIDYLRMEGYLTPEKIVERDGWNTRKRRDFANKVVDEMEESGEIKKLHRNYRDEIETAREMKSTDRFFK
ncbi:MAG: hypothetical protein M1820_003251 [Bogoriella megaspora]|nr:MAG: hypothetical protein M1820_003251 [Bogoriella megaspora]